ncbi:MAG: nitrous oxide reductase accessory protein NosL [Nitratireductor sp.]|nr:nitrous oxide reductase accessory protein NosL [Nitratireductor sp.]
MRKSLLCAALLFSQALALSACSDAGSGGAVPGPVAMTEEAVGHYCSMTVLEHEGPKAQIHLAGIDQPIWFTQVRDAVAFLRSPEERYEAVAVYVHDMEKAASWAHPGDQAWIDAHDAWFVIGSRKTGGMGTPEAIPFGSEAAADAFIGEYGGEAVRLDAIPDAYVLGPVALNDAGPQAGSQ